MRTKPILYLILAVFLGTSIAFAQKASIQLPIMNDSIYSEVLEEYRQIKVYLPKEYNESKKYPVIYTLDGAWMFEPTVFESRILADFQVMPSCIVVGLFHKDRNADLGMDWESGNFSSEGSKFYQHLSKEVIPSIDSAYATSAFRILIGHSNGATFAHRALLEKDQPFRSFIAISQNLFGEQAQSFAELDSLPAPSYYYVASGSRDATPRLESGILLDSLFRRPIPHLKTQHQLFDADHSGLVAHGLNNGLSFVFSDYKHCNDWDEDLIDSLFEASVAPMEFLEAHTRSIELKYSIPFEPNQDDLSVMQAITRSDEDIAAVQAFEIKHFGQGDEFYATYAQYYEYIPSYEKALEYWNLNLRGDYPHNENFFYYRRPIELIYKKMKDPKRAIQYIKQLMKDHPDQSLGLNYMLGKMATESGIETVAGSKALQFCIDNYNPNRVFDLSEAQELQSALQNK